MTGSSSIRLRKAQEEQQLSQPPGRALVPIAPTPVQRALRLGSFSSLSSLGTSSDDDKDDGNAGNPQHQQQRQQQQQQQQQSSSRDVTASTSAAAPPIAAPDRSTTPALPPPAPAQISTAQDHLEQRRRRAEDDAKMAHAQHILEREIRASTPHSARAASPRILPSPFHHHHHHHQHHHLPHHHHPLSILRPASAASRRSSSDSARRPRPGHLPDPVKSAVPVSLQGAQIPTPHQHRRRRSRRPPSLFSTDSTSRRGPRRGVVATISARHRAAAEKKEALRRQKRLKRFSELDPLLATGALDEDAVRAKKEREQETTRAIQRELELTLPGRRPADEDDADNDHHNWEVVDTLDVVDPGVATVSALTNVANSIVFPYLPSLFNRMPVVDLPLERPEPDARSSLSSSDNRPLVASAAPTQAGAPWSQRLRRRLTRAPHPPPAPSAGASASSTPAEASTALEEGRAQTPGAGGGALTRVPTSHSLQSARARRKAKRAERKAARMLEKERQLRSDPLDTHVETLLNNRKRAQLKRVLQGLWAFLKTPQGIIVGIYGFLVVFCGAALVIFLLGWIDHGRNKDFWVEVFSQAVNALFTLTGVGLIPWRVRDTYRMAGICYYQHKVWRLRKQAHLPPLKDKNDLPDSQAPMGDIEERKARIIVDGKQYGEGDVPSEPPTPLNGLPPERAGSALSRPSSAASAGAVAMAAAGKSAAPPANVPGRTGTPLQTILESNSASGGLALDQAAAAAAAPVAHSRARDGTPRLDPLRTDASSLAGAGAGAGAGVDPRDGEIPPRSALRDPSIDRVRSPPIARTSSPLGRPRRAPSPIARAGTASPTLSAGGRAGGSAVRSPSIHWEPFENPAPGGPMGHFVERPTSAAQVLYNHHHHPPHLFRPGSAPPTEGNSGGGALLVPAPDGAAAPPRVSPLRESVGAAHLGYGGEGKGDGAAPLSAVPSQASVDSSHETAAAGAHKRSSLFRGRGPKDADRGAGDAEVGSGYFHRSRTNLESPIYGTTPSGGGGGGGGPPSRYSSANLSQYYSAEEEALLQDIQVLIPRDAHRLHVLQTQFAHGASWYRPHETPTHRAFPIATALWITILNDGNSLFQCMLCGVMWGFATHYKDRPAWTTGALIPCSFLCGIGAAVLIAMGSKKTKKTDEVEERLRAAFAERERAYLERKRRLEEDADEDEDDEDEDDDYGKGMRQKEAEDEDEDENPVSRLEALAADPHAAAVAFSSAAPPSSGPSAPSPVPIARSPLFNLNHPSPVRPLAQRGVPQPLDFSGDDEDKEADVVGGVRADGGAGFGGAEDSGRDSYPMATLGHQLASAGALSSLQHFEDALDREDHDDEEKALRAATDGPRLLARLDTADARDQQVGGDQQAEERVAAAAPTLLSPVSEEDATRLAEQAQKEEEQTDAGVATAFFGLGGVQGLRGPK